MWEKHRSLVSSHTANCRDVAVQSEPVCPFVFPHGPVWTWAKFWWRRGNATGNRRLSTKVKKANILKNSYQNQRNFLILDIGSENGVHPEMGVISNNGIVGVVHSVTKNYSNVISILNQDLKINVRTNKNPAFGSLVWSGKNPLEFKIEDIVSNASLAKGDTIITGGMSSYFPLGIPIGKISKLEKIKGSGYYSANATLFNDPSQIYYAYILENLDSQELKSLQKKISQ